MPNINQDLQKTRLQYDDAAKGIRNPAVTLLVTGEDLYRFTSSRSPGTGLAIPPTRQLYGPWWFRSRDWQKILKSYLSGTFNLGTTARIAGAVQWSWSDMDVLLKARVTQPIEAWEGPGLAQYRDVLPNGMSVTGMPGAAAGLRIVDRLAVASTDQRGNSTGASYGGAR
jgi:hypothetical protein